MRTIPLQLELRPEIPNVYGTMDYREFRDTLVKIDEILTKSCLEHKLVMTALEQYVAKNEPNGGDFYNSRKSQFHYRKFKHALRCNIARHLTGESYRSFSIRLADSKLFQWFTSISAFSCRKAISKSSLERYEKGFDENLIAKEIRKWLAELSSTKKALVSGTHNRLIIKDYSLTARALKPIFTFLLTGYCFEMPQELFYWQSKPFELKD